MRYLSANKLGLHEEPCDRGPVDGRRVSAGKDLDIPKSDIALYAEALLQAGCIPMVCEAVRPRCSPVIYIGEAVSLVDRIRRVTKPTRQSKPSDTNARLNKIFTDHQSQGFVITVEQAAFVEFALNGVVFSPTDMTLWHKFKRCALENLILCSCLALGDGLLNLRLEPYKRIEKQILAAGVDPAVVRKMDVKKVIGAL